MDIGVEYSWIYNLVICFYFNLDILWNYNVIKDYLKEENKYAYSVK